MTDADQYCSLDVPYPIHAYGTVLSVTRPDGVTVSYPARSIHADLPDITTDIQKLDEELTKNGDAFEISDICVVYPLTHLRSYPLRREFWGHADESFTDTDRITPFLRAVRHPEMHMLLVTPKLERDVWRFMAPLPFPVSSDDSMINQFMSHSDWVVSETAKNCALYKFEKPFVYNWVNKLQVDGAVVSADSVIKH